MSAAVHALNSESARVSSPAIARNGTPAAAVRPFIWHSREDALRARVEERQSQAEAILAEHGTLKHEYLAAVLGVSRQRVARGFRDGFSAEQMARLVAGERKVAA